MMLETGMEVAQYYNVLNYGTPRPHEYLKPQVRAILDHRGMNPAPIFFSQGAEKRKLGDMAKHA